MTQPVTNPLLCCYPISNGRVCFKKKTQTKLMCPLHATFTQKTNTQHGIITHVCSLARSTACSRQVTAPRRGRAGNTTSSHSRNQPFSSKTPAKQQQPTPPPPQLGHFNSGLTGSTAAALCVSCQQLAGG